MAKPRGKGVAVTKKTVDTTKKAGANKSIDTTKKAGATNKTVDTTKKASATNKTVDKTKKASATNKTLGTAKKAGVDDKNSFQKKFPSTLFKPTNNSLNRERKKHDVTPTAKPKWKENMYQDHFSNTVAHIYDV